MQQSGFLKLQSSGFPLFMVRASNRVRFMSCRFCCLTRVTSPFVESPGSVPRVTVQDPALLSLCSQDYTCTCSFKRHADKSISNFNMQIEYIISFVEGARKLSARSDYLRATSNYLMDGGMNMRALNSICECHISIIT